MKNNTNNLVDSKTFNYLSLEELKKLHDSKTIDFIPRYEKKYLEYIEKGGHI